jgi:hypothetical protein
VTASAATAHPSSATKPLTLYSLGSAEQFVNNKDDRARGEGNNPFGNYTDVTALAQTSGNGPFAGDEAIFQLRLFSDPQLQKSAGVAVFTCLYNFNKNGYCDVTFQLHGGTLVGSGAFNFNSTKFTLAITGGDGKYIAQSGLMDESPAANHAQRLVFALS